MNEKIYNENIIILCFHNTTDNDSTLRAVAYFDHYPTLEDLFALDAFDRNVKLDCDLAKILLENKMAGIADNKDSWHFQEYIFIHPLVNGDLELHEYLLTGYCDSNPEKLMIYYEDYE